MKKLNLKQLLSVSLTLFAIFFGAGNMIFPQPWASWLETTSWPLWQASSSPTQASPFWA